LVESHEMLLAHINASGCQDVWNIDYHSDLADPDKKGRVPLNCGTWGNHVRFRRKGTFIWCAPRPGCRDHSAGWCHISRNPFRYDCSGWKRTRSFIGTKRIPWEQVHAVGVAISPDYFKAQPVANVMRKLRLRTDGSFNGGPDLTSAPDVVF